MARKCHSVSDHICTLLWRPAPLLLTGGGPRRAPCTPPMPPFRTAGRSPPNAAPRRTGFPSAERGPTFFQEMLTLLLLLPQRLPGRQRAEQCVVVPQAVETICPRGAVGPSPLRGCIQRTDERAQAFARLAIGRRPPGLMPITSRSVYYFFPSRRRAAKNSLSTAAHRSARTPLTTRARWFSRGSVVIW